MSQSKIILRALPNVEFVHGYPGIPASPDRPQASVRGMIEVRLGSQPISVKWIKVDLLKVESIPSGSNGEEFVDSVGQSPMTVWQSQEDAETISKKDFPFNIRLPETIPPSVALGRGAGIKYKIVATLCMKGKKGLLRREASTVISNSVPVVIEKHELHSTWPVYAQPESRQVTSDGLTLVVNRSNTCFAPTDRLGVRVTLRSDNLSPVVLRGFEYSLRETIIYRAGEQRVPVSMTLYGGTQHKVELTCIVPGNHTTSSVNSGRHIDIRHTMNIKAIMDKARPIAMELPVTITNWPRHVSADLIRRIGTAPNLSLNLPTEPRTSSVPQAPDLRSSLQRSPVSDMSNISKGDRRPPPGALVSGRPGSPAAGNVSNGKNPYSADLYEIPSESPLASGSVGGHPSAAPAQKTFSNAKDTSVSNPQGIAATEFGSRRPVDVFSAATSRHSQNYDPDKIIDVTRRSNSLGNYRFSTDQDTAGPLDDFGGTKIPTGHTRASFSGATSSIRRPRAASRPLQIVNATEDIPEEDITSKTCDDSLQGYQRTCRSVSPVIQSSSSTAWPTAEEEKKRSFDKVQAQVEKFHAARVQANAVATLLVQNNTPPYSNGRGHAPTSEQLVLADGSGTVSPSRLTESMSENSSAARSTYHRKASASSSQDSARKYHTGTSPPISSAGAALYSHAIASMKNPMMATTNSPHPSSPRSSSLQMEPSNIDSATSSTKQYPMVEDEKAAIRFREAQKGVERRLKQDALPQEDPIAYEALFPSEGSYASSVSSPRAQFVQLPEKEVARQAFEARDATLAADPPISPSHVLMDMANESRSVARQIMGSPGPPERDVSRRASEAQDSAMVGSGHIPPAAMVAMSSPSPHLSGWGSGSTSVHAGLRERTLMSEKERIKIAFENRDRAVAAQQAPPGYGTPSTFPVPSFNHADGEPLTAAQEKALLKARYADEELHPTSQTEAWAEGNPATPSPVVSPHPSSPTGDLRTSEVSEGYSPRDPTISAGKQRASQMMTPPPPPPPPPPSSPPPPPLLPRPPAEYLEETRLEDMRNYRAQTMMFPTDFAAPFDLGFSPFANEREGTSSTSVIP